MRKAMRRGVLVCVVATGVLAVGGARNDDEKTVRKAVERCTLDQRGTKPFHLKAEIAPTHERDSGSNRTGGVEIWWAAPGEWKREVRSPEFHQIAIVNGGNEWQKNEGEYFPEWLRQTSVALIEPVPNTEEVLKHVREAEVKSLAGSTYYSWMEMSGDGRVEKGLGGSLAITQGTGLIFYGGGLGWGALYHDYKDFHGRMVGRVVSSGTPEVTARIITLEDLGNEPAGFFDAGASGSDTLIRTAVADEMTLRKNLMQGEPVVWPAAADGPLEGVLTTSVTVDREGKVRELESIVSDNPAMNEAADKTIKAMRFRPYVQDGTPVQVVSRITMPFKTERPTGTEKFESARHYFEWVRKVSFPSAPGAQPYILRATFQVSVEGKAQEGQYVDTWKSAEEWKREATLGDTHVVRARHVDTRYESAGGSQLKLLRTVLMRETEPLPMMDSFYEADWRIKRDKVDDVDTIRVMAGYESPDGHFDPEQTRGYWIDEKGRLVRTYLSGLETKRSDFVSFGNAQIAQEIKVLRDGKVGMLIHVTEVKAAGNLPDSTFVVEGRQYKSSSDAR